MARIRADGLADGRTGGRRDERTHARTHDGPGGAAARAAPPPARARAAPAAAPPAGPEVPLRRRPRRPPRVRARGPRGAAPQACPGGSAGRACRPGPVVRSGAPSPVPASSPPPRAGLGGRGAPTLSGGTSRARRPRSRPARPYGDIGVAGLRRVVQRAVQPQSQGTGGSAGGAGRSRRSPARAVSAGPPRRSGLGAPSRTDELGPGSPVPREPPRVWGTLRAFAPVAAEHGAPALRPSKRSLTPAASPGPRGSPRKLPELGLLPHPPAGAWRAPARGSRHL